MSHTSSPSTKPRCYYCGNNPTSHTMAKVDSFVLLFLNPHIFPLLRTWFGRVVVAITEVLYAGMVQLFLVTGIAKFTTDHTVITSDRGAVMAEESDRRGWVMETLIVFGHVHDAYRLQLPSGQRIFFSGIPRLDPIKNAIAGWMDDKAVLKAKLLAAGVTASQGASFIRWSSAKRYFLAQKQAVIVKPRFGSRGRHTTTHITTLEQFEAAFWRAKQLNISVIVEEHLVGSVYRATMVGGKLAGVLTGEPPRITGDGIHTITELVKLKNDSRPARVGEVIIRDINIAFLARQNFTPDTILTVGTTIDLIEKIGLSYGGLSREDTPRVHPKLRIELERASLVVDDPIHGFDFISPDISADPDTVRWGIIECNSVPFINLHHDPLVGIPVNVAGILFSDLAKNCSKFL